MAWQSGDWVVKNFGKIVASQLISPIFNGFYFQSLDNSSAAMASAVLAFSVCNPKIMTLTSGIGSLPKKLPDNLNVKTSVLVSEIIQTLSGVTVYTSVYKKEVFRWQYAMPCTPVGRAKAVKEYRDTRNSHNRVWLAGDYLGLPWTDSAAETGLWAADRICTKIYGTQVK